ncbi:hypothetical protein BP5796_02323 [Coleophoma crateriformis]|uniref:Protein kinase domain-containing protein n=1 Tax=Coleophoma crateriformis TaxID=565419 RepID=A0A3D8SZG5_9HELO|nr:hypothetical protein BP5796_02323 [Coleophoma crateriformis]
MAYSNSGGGTLTLPSPTHVHHVDVTSAVRSLRRSLSRSPSKFRLVTKSPSPSPKSPLSPSPLSPPKRASSQPALFGNSQTNPPHTPSPLAVPFPPSAKLALRSSTRSKTAPARPPPRTRTPPKSPMKRALSEASDTGNATPTPQRSPAEGQENKSSSVSPAERKRYERKSLERGSKMPLNLDTGGPLNHTFSRLGEGSNEVTTTTSSPLKRSDAIMNLDQASLGSPVAKRRSLHGSASFGHDFNIFDQGPSPSPHFDVHDELNQEYELSASSLAENSATSSFTSMPRRSSSLRKSTLQQRHGEKTSWGRRHAAQVLAAQQAAMTAPEIATPNSSKNRPRLSLDQFMPPLARDSPFSSQGSLPNASIHMASQPAHQPHPLSRTMTTSSSSSSIVDESPTHVPVHFGDQPRPKLDFSKSLPAGSLRPFSLDLGSEERSGSFSTPKNYKSVKPLPAAFMSTGLISKVNRNPEEPQPARGTGKSNMPDTPCKKHVNGFATYPAPVPGSAIAKARHIRHSFGTPSTPFNPHGTQPKQSTFGKGVSVFGSAFGNNRLMRRSSFLSMDGDDSASSPDAKGDGQISIDFDLPPTPTKQAFAPAAAIQLEDHGSPSSHRSFPQSAVGLGLMKKIQRSSSKLNLLTSPDDRADGSDDEVSLDPNDSPTTSNFRLYSDLGTSMPSFGRSRALRVGSHGHTQPPLVVEFLPTSFLSISSKPGFAKFSHVAPASPLERVEFIERRSPRTPVDSMTPPDPSGLSISNHRDANAGGASMLPPATPTAGRDYFAQLGDRRLSTTPVSGFAPSEVDDSLTSRFEKAEMIGTGEFSYVYRVTEAAQPPTAMKSFQFGAINSPTRRSPTTPLEERIFAVKKSRQPFQGARDRQRKLQEVDVLKALGHSDHVVHFIDHWEQKDHLYIQTEFCEEGSLDLFLSQVGRKGRLDDFRIWKIMLELSLGLKHIHNSGYIHLDLKPANIFITFEGVLKIGDFGMAAHWPAQPDIEGEGDREYIGPEILLGKYDKPSDVFALGLIMLEIAGNVQLPDNGPTWQRLRSGDMSDVPSLTWSSASTILRDATGIPIEDSDISMDFYGSDEEIEHDFGSPSISTRKRSVDCSNRSFSHDPANLFGSIRRGELHQAPVFMRDMHHDHALDRIVRWMISPAPEDRPLIHQVLESDGLQWVEARRRAGATVFEGNWGPADDILADDAEMMDV